MAIYDRDKMNQLEVFPTKKTPSYADWNLFEMGKELEERTTIYPEPTIEDEGKTPVVNSDGEIEFDYPSFTPGESGVVVPDEPATGANAVNKNYVDSLDIGTSDDESSSSGSLWARIKYVLSNMVDKITDQTIGGIKTFTSNPKVANPESGATDTSVVNANWVSQTGDDRPNNLIHTTGNESKSGNMSMTGTFKGIYWGASGLSTSNGFTITERDTSQNVVTIPNLNRYFPPILFEDGGGNRVAGLRAVHNINGTTSLVVTLRNADGTYKNTTLATSDP